MKTTRIVKFTRTEEQWTGSAHSPLILQSETADLVQGSVVGEVHAVWTNVEPDDERLPQSVHGELNLSTFCHGV